jgi:hypothetical protein
VGRRARDRIAQHQLNQAAARTQRASCATRIATGPPTTTTSGARHPTRRWWAPTAVGATATAIAIAMLATAAPAASTRTSGQRAHRNRGSRRRHHADLLVMPTTAGISLRHKGITADGRHNYGTSRTARPRPTQTSRRRTDASAVLVVDISSTFSHGGRLQYPFELRDYADPITRIPLRRRRSGIRSA